MPLDPQVEAKLKADSAAGLPPRSTLTAEQARALPDAARAHTAPLAPVGRIQSLTIPGPGGDLPLRVYTPPGAGPFPVLLHIHGGGWVLLGIDDFDRECRFFCAEAGYLVVAVDYRRAPEAPFPGPLDDCVAALRWVVAHAAELGGDLSRLVVGGDSAGGNLTAATTLVARDQGIAPLAGQLLIYPVADYHEPGTGSYTAYASGYGLSRDDMRWFWGHYVGQAPQQIDPLAAPLRYEDLRGLPPALVLLAEYDVLHDEGLRYAERLESAGVPTTVREYQGMNHGFVHMSGEWTGGRRALADAAAWLREIAAAQPGQRGEHSA